MTASPLPTGIPAITYHGITLGALAGTAFLYLPQGGVLSLAGPVITTLWVIEWAVAGGFAGFFASTFAPERARTG
jgi:tetrahydromethanopterin S-methyltransferase subunit C